MTGGGKSGEVGRVVAIGASNLTRGLQTVVATARGAWGPDIQVVAALGHGRSYGADSHFLFRRLPGILQSGLWPLLDAMPGVPTRALVTDVGNDILYGAPSDRILAWVDRCVARLRTFTADVVVAGLPLDALHQLTPRRFAAFRTLFYPPSRVGFGEGLASADTVERGLREIADRHRARFVAMRGSWYRVDPVHIRPRAWREAWGEIAGLGEIHGAGWGETARLLTLPSERRRLFGVERIRPQAGTPLRGGGRVWLY